MGTQSASLEERLKSFLIQLQTESGILDRIVYKGKNQHRRCLYFQYLLKVRRDLRVLQSAHLEEILNFLFQVMNGKKPTQTVQLLESFKRRKCNSSKHNFQARLLGVARLLSQMVEPMLKAAIEISTLLARSFFTGFCLTVLALLARLRVLVQQILLDVVSGFNMLSSLSQKEQSIKLIQEGIEVFREYYPPNEEVITLECVWERDKFVLQERTNKTERKKQDVNLGEREEISLGGSIIQYQSIEALLGENEVGYKMMDTDSAVEDLSGSTDTKHKNNVFADPFVKIDDGTQVEDCGDDGCTDNAGSPNNNFTMEVGIVASSSIPPSPKSPKLQSGSRDKVAFLSVRKPTPSETKEPRPPALVKAITSARADDKEDPFFNLLTGGNMKDSLF